MRSFLLTLYWGLLLYLCAVGFVSVVPQVFATPKGDEASARCDRAALRAMHDDLRRGGAGVLSELSPESGKDRVWLVAWDRQALAMRGSCQGEALEELTWLMRLRYRLDESLQRVVDEEKQVARHRCTHASH